MTDLPRRAVTRTAKLATLPLGFAGRTALGLGKRIGGRPAELVTAEIQQRTAEQLFKVLGELKGGAMKFGQAMSVFEAALPEEMAGPYRATLTKLQEPRRRCPPRPSTRCSPTQLRPAVAAAVPLASTTSRRPRPPSARCTAAVWADGRDGRRQGAVPRRRRRR